MEVDTKTASDSPGIMYLLDYKFYYYFHLKIGVILYLQKKPKRILQ